MCGIAGYATVHPKPEGQLAQLGSYLGIFNEARGTHSWGFSNGTDIVKDVGKFSDGMGQIEWPSPGMALIHTRMATTGAHTKENAHPFLVEHGSNRVIGAHNGIINNHTALNLKYRRSCSVDSQHLFHHLAEKRSFSDIEGYGAIVFFLNGVLHFAKFNGGSLTIADLPGGGLAWSSDTDHLLKACKGVGLKVETYKLEYEKLYYYNPAPEHDSLFVSSEKMKVGPRVIRTVCDSSTHYGYGNYKSNQHNNGGPSKQDPDPMGIIKIRIVSPDRLVALTDADTSEVIDLPPTPPPPTKVGALEIWRESIRQHILKMPTSLTRGDGTNYTTAKGRCICCNNATSRIIHLCIDDLITLLDTDYMVHSDNGLPEAIRALEPPSEPAPEIKMQGEC